MSQLLDQIRLNVGRIRVTTEKERWDANAEMRRVLIDNNGGLTPAAATTLEPYPASHVRRGCPAMPATR